MDAALKATFTRLYIYVSERFRLDARFLMSGLSTPVNSASPHLYYKRNGKGSKFVSNEDTGVRSLKFNMGQLLEVTLVYVVSFQAIQSYVSA